MADAGKDGSGFYRLERLVGEDAWEAVTHEGVTWDELSRDEVELAMMIFVDKYPGISFRVHGTKGLAAWYDQAAKAVMVSDPTLRT